MRNSPAAGTAKELRQRQTEAEKRLWFKLRDHQLCGVKFRRQALIGKYIVDFISFEQKLVIEVDGSPHRQGETRINDRERGSWLKSEGFKVLRFWNAEITSDFENVIKRIDKYLKERLKN